MNYFKVQSGIFIGNQFFSVEIECVHARRLPFLQILGCNSPMANEMRERIRAAMDSAGFRLPARRFTVRFLPNLPNISVENLDLAISLALLGSAGVFSAEKIKNILVMGSLGLDGSILGSTLGVFYPEILKNYQGAIIPWDDSAVLPDEILKNGGGFRNLREVVEFLLRNSPQGKKKNDFEDIKNTFLPSVEPNHFGIVKRGLEIAAAGAHHSIVFGPEPLAAQFAELLLAYLPPLNRLERGEIAANRILFGLTKIDSRPFIDANHSFGGKALGKNCSMSLAHHGVLFCSGKVLEKEISGALSSVMRERRIENVVSGIPVCFPVKAIVVGRSRLCVCGSRGIDSRACKCRREELRKIERWNASLMAKFDLTLLPDSDSSADIDPIELRRDRVQLARTKMQNRGFLNGQASETQIFDCPWSKNAKLLLKKRSIRGRPDLSLARLSLSICDLRGGNEVSDADVLEAKFFRQDGLGVLGSMS